MQTILEKQLKYKQMIMEIFCDIYFLFKFIIFSNADIIEKHHNKQYKQK